MSALKGLGAYKARKDEADARRNANRIDRLTLTKDGDSVVVRFAQEIDFDAKGYEESAGVGYINLFHKHPSKDGWKNSADCSTEDQGACYPCERVEDRDVEWDQRKGWKQKEKFLINVIAGEPKVVEVNGKDRNFPTDIDTKTGDGHVYLLEQSTYGGIYDTLADYATDRGTITDTFFRIKRKGGPNDGPPSYSLTLGDALPKGAKPGSEYELIDLDSTHSQVPYAQQKAFYHNGMADESEASGNTTAAAASSDEGDAKPSAPAANEW